MTTLTDNDRAVIGEVTRQVVHELVADGVLQTVGDCAKIHASLASSAVKAAQEIQDRATAARDVVAAAAAAAVVTAANVPEKSKYPEWVRIFLFPVLVSVVSSAVTMYIVWQLLMYSQRAVKTP